jgi:hypothetical protein
MSLYRERYQPFRFDIEFPIECDDDYWEHPDPSQCFKQPSGVPSTVTFFVLMLQLMSLYNFTLQVAVSVLLDDVSTFI